MVEGECTLRHVPTVNRAQVALAQVRIQICTTASTATPVERKCYFERAWVCTLYLVIHWTANEGVG